MSSKMTFLRKCHFCFIPLKIKMLDRTISPDFQTIKAINFPPVKAINLSNGIPLYVINVGEQPVIKIEFSFEAGNWQETSKRCFIVYLPK